MLFTENMVTVCCCLVRRKQTESAMLAIKYCGSPYSWGLHLECARGACSTRFACLGDIRQEEEGTKLNFEIMRETRTTLLFGTAKYGSKEGVRDLS